MLKRALAIRESQLGVEHPDVAISLSNLAVLSGYHGRCAENEPLLQRAIAIAEQALGLDHPDTQTYINNYQFLKVKMQPIAPPSSRNVPCPCGSRKRYKHCHGNLSNGEYNKVQPSQNQIK